MQCLLQCWPASHIQTLLLVAYQSQYIFQQPGSLKSLVMWTDMYVLGCWYYNWTLFLWCPKVFKCNWAAKEIYIQQPNIYKKSLYEDVYIIRWLLAKYMKDLCVRPWLLAWKYFGRTRNSKRTYKYVFGCWCTDRMGAGRAHQGRIYTSLAVGKNLLGTQRVNVW